MRRPINATERLQARYIPEGHTVYREIPGGIVYSGKRTTQRSGEMISAIAFRGSSMNREWWRLFMSEQQLNEATEQFFDGIRAHQEFKKKRRESRSKEETDTQKVKKALKAAGYAVKSVRHDTGTAANWIQIVIDDYDQYIDKNGYRQRHYSDVMSIAKEASGRADLHDDPQTDYFCVNISIDFLKHHTCAECLIENCTQYHTPESCTCGGFYSREMADADRQRQERETPATQAPAPAPRQVGRYDYLGITIEEVQA